MIHKKDCMAWHDEMLCRLQRHSHKHWHRLCAQFPKLHRIDPPTIEISYRLKFGFALTQMQEGKATIIRYSAHFLQRKDLLALYQCEVVPHEIAHAGAWHLYGEHAHSQRWAGLCRLLGIPARLRVPFNAYQSKD